MTILSRVTKDTNIDFMKFYIRYPQKPTAYINSLFFKFFQT